MALHIRFWSNDKGFALMLLVMVATIVTTQIPIENDWVELLIVRFGFFLFTVIAIATSVLSPATKKLGYGIAVTLLVFAFFLVEFQTDEIIFVYTVLLAAYMTFIFALVIKQIMDGEKITIQKILGGAAAYILIGHLWTAFYITIYQLNTESFQWMGEPIVPDQSLKHLSYFSFVTLTTIGYGDIIAVAPVARILVILEGLLGQLFPAIFIAKLVSLHIEPSKAEHHNRDDF
jgi:voltage-gated potassium channel Kch